MSAPLQSTTLPEIGGRVTVAQVGADELYVVALEGEIDVYTAPTLKARLLELLDRGARAVVVDLSQTSFVDSVTLGALLAATKRATASGRELRVVCDDRRVLRVFEITGLGPRFHIDSTLAGALAALAQNGRASGGRP